MEFQSVIGASCASPDWAIHIAPDTSIIVCFGQVLNDLIDFCVR
jgi:hypothetical protein